MKESRKTKVTVIVILICLAFLPYAINWVVTTVSEWVPQCNDVTLTSLLEALKVEYPSAHIYSGTVYDDNGDIKIGEDTEIFLFSGTDGTFVGRFSFDYGNPDEYNTSRDFKDNGYGDFEIFNLKSESELKNILNIIMPLYFNNWTNATTNECVNALFPNEEFIELENFRGLEYKNVDIVGFDKDEMTVCFL